MNWSISQLKENAKLVLKNSYWMCVVVGIIMTAIHGGLGGGAGRVGNTITNTLNRQNHVKNYDFNFDNRYTFNDPSNEDVNTDLNPANAVKLISVPNSINAVNINASGINTINAKSFNVKTLLTSNYSSLRNNSSLGAGLVAILGIFFVFFIIAALIGAAIGIFVINPLSVGCKGFFSKQIYTSTQVGEIISPFKNNYKNTILTMFLMNIFISLWSLLLIVPGIIKAYEYRMIPYILANDPTVTWREAFERSRRMMYGEKMNAFLLDLSFIGWIILTVLTCGILGIFYVTPYVQLTDAFLFDALREKGDMPYIPAYEGAFGPGPQGGAQTGFNQNFNNTQQNNFNQNYNNPGQNNFNQGFNNTQQNNFNQGNNNTQQNNFNQSFNGTSQNNYDGNFNNQGQNNFNQNFNGTNQNNYDGNFNNQGQNNFNQNFNNTSQNNSFNQSTDNQSYNTSVDTSVNTSVDSSYNSAVDTTVNFSENSDTDTFLNKYSSDDNYTIKGSDNYDNNDSDINQ